MSFGHRVCGSPTRGSGVFASEVAQIPSQGMLSCVLYQISSRLASGVSFTRIPGLWGLKRVPLSALIVRLLEILASQPRPCAAPLCRDVVSPTARTNFDHEGFRRFGRKIQLIYALWWGVGLHAPGDVWYGLLRAFGTKTDCRNMS